MPIFSFSLLSLEPKKPENGHLNNHVSPSVVLSFDHQNHSKWHKWFHVHYIGLRSVRSSSTIYEGVGVSACVPKARSGGTRDRVGLGFEFGSGTGKGTALMGKAHLAV